MWHEWNADADDIMIMWFTSYANLVTSHLACTMCMCMHGTHALNKYGAFKYPRGLVGMQADSYLEKITASHF